MAGAPGLEPGNGGIKIRCLTTWLRPNDTALFTLAQRADHSGAGAGEQHAQNFVRSLPEAWIVGRWIFRNRGTQVLQLHRADTWHNGTCREKTAPSDRSRTGD